MCGNRSRGELLRSHRCVGLDGPAAMPTNLSLVAPDKGAVFIFIPERAREAELLEQECPGEKMLTFPRQTKKETLFIAYEMSPR